MLKGRSILISLSLTLIVLLTMLSVPLPPVYHARAQGPTNTPMLGGVICDDPKIMVQPVTSPTIALSQTITASLAYNGVFTLAVDVWDSSWNFLGTYYSQTDTSQTKNITISLRHLTTHYLRVRVSGTIQAACHNRDGQFIEYRDFAPSTNQDIHWAQLVIKQVEARIKLPPWWCDVVGC